MKTMIQLPPLDGRQVYINPKRVQSIERGIFSGMLRIQMNTPEHKYEYSGSEADEVIAILRFHEVLPGYKAPVGLPQTTAGEKLA